MRTERWYWLPIFCIVSVVIQGAVVYLTRGFGTGNNSVPMESPSVEVTFTPTETHLARKPEPRARHPKHIAHATVRTRVHRPAHVAAIHHRAARPKVNEAHPIPAVITVPDRIAAEIPTVPHRTRTAHAARIIHRSVARPLIQSDAAPAVNSSRNGAPMHDVPTNNVAYAGSTANPAAPSQTGSWAGSILHDRADNPLGDAFANDTPEIGTRAQPASAAAITTNRSALQLAEADILPMAMPGRSGRNTADTPDNTAYAGGSGSAPAAPGASGSAGETRGSVLRLDNANPLGDGIPDDRPGARAQATSALAAAIRRAGGAPQLAGGASSPAGGAPGRAGRLSRDTITAEVGYAGNPGGRTQVTGAGARTVGDGRGSILHGNDANLLTDGIPEDRPEARAHGNGTSGGGIRRGGGAPRLGGGGGSSVARGSGRSGERAQDGPAGGIGYVGRAGDGAQAAMAGRLTGGEGRGSVLHGKGANPLGDGIADDRPSIGAGGGTRGGTGELAFGAGTSGLRRGGGPKLGASEAYPELQAKSPGRGGRGRRADQTGPGVAGLSGGSGLAGGTGTDVADALAAGGPDIRQGGGKYGNVAGLLHGAVGTVGRGALFQIRPADGSDDPVHIIYALDISHSMEDGNKIGKAKDALKKALSGLRPADTFNIIPFCRTTASFRDKPVYATPETLAQAQDYVNSIETGNGTDISAVMDLALSMQGITHIYLMSDGLPNSGIKDVTKLGRFVHDRNTGKVRITALALGLGERFAGMRLLKTIADESGGTYDYINLADSSMQGRKSY